MNKIFTLSGLNRQPFKVNLKCNPERAIELREEYESAIKPGYHMSKTHWNTVELDGSFSNELFFELVDHSYDLIVKGLTKKMQKELNTTEN